MAKLNPTDVLWTKRSKMIKLNPTNIYGERYPSDYINKELDK